jgi:predicted O-methyltransferase YrrM
LEQIRSDAPFSFGHNGDIALARCCYLLCRALKPAVVLETGVAYGATTAFMLSALHENSKGQLWSIDLPPLGEEADRYVGALIPQVLKDRWHLHRGASKRMLPGLLKAVGDVDLFVHDSLHTHRSMLREFQTVWPFLRPGGVIIADDVNDSSAFAEFTQMVDPSFCAVVREQNKGSLFGVIMKGVELSPVNSNKVAS